MANNLQLLKMLQNKKYDDLELALKENIRKEELGRKRNRATIRDKIARKTVEMQKHRMSGPSIGMTVYNHDGVDHYCFTDGAYLITDTENIYDIEPAKVPVDVKMIIESKLKDPYTFMIDPALIKTRNSHNSIYSAYIQDEIGDYDYLIGFDIKRLKNVIDFTGTYTVTVDLNGNPDEIIYNKRRCKLLRGITTLVSKSDQQHAYLMPINLDLDDACLSKSQTILKEYTYET